MRTGTLYFDKPHAAQDVWKIIDPVFDNREPSRMEIIQVVRAGLPGVVVSRTAKAFDIPKTELYSYLHISAKTAQRAAENKLDQDKSNRLVQIIRAFQRSIEVFGDFVKAKTWLRNPCNSLGGQPPLSLLDTTEGYELVVDTLGRIEHGIFA